MAPHIGYPYDPVKLAKAKEQTLNNLLSSRARAWHAYFDTMSLAYDAAHSQHENTLNGIKQAIIDKVALVRDILFNTLFPAMIGGGMTALIAKGEEKEIVDKLLPVATAHRESLRTKFADGATEVAVEDSIKLAVSSALNQLVPHPGSEWDAAGDSPLKFFLQANRMVDQYTTDVIHNVEQIKTGVRTMEDLDHYIDVLNANLLSPFITHAPMAKESYYHETELGPIYEIFLWIRWARQSDRDYWGTQLSRAQTPDDRSVIGKVWDAYVEDDDALARVKAMEALKDLDPILERLVQCGIQKNEVGEPASWDTSRRILNMFWLRGLANNHHDTLLHDLVKNAESKVPKSAFDDKVVDRSRPLK